MSTIKYKCHNCGAQDNYTLTMERFVDFIYDGPFNLPIGEDDRGSVVMAYCNVCKEELDIDKEDFDRLYIPKKGVIFYKTVRT